MGPPRSLSVDDWIKKMWHIYTRTLLSHKRKKSFLLQQNGYNWNPLFLAKYTSPKRQVLCFSWSVIRENIKQCKLYEQDWHLRLDYCLQPFAYTLEELQGFFFPLSVGYVLKSLPNGVLKLWLWIEIKVCHLKTTERNKQEIGRWLGNTGRKGEYGCSIIHYIAKSVLWNACSYYTYISTNLASTSKLKSFPRETHSIKTTRSIRADIWNKTEISQENYTPTPLTNINTKILNKTLAKIGWSIYYVF